MAGYKTNHQIAQKPLLNAMKHLDVIRKLNSTCSNWLHSICHNNYVIILGFLVTQKVTIKMIKLWLPLNNYNYANP